MTSRKSWDVVVVGDLFIDEIFSDFYTLPKLGEEAFARRFKREIGGGAAITASGLGRLGLKVAVVGVVGSEDAVWLIKRLTAERVDTDALELDPDEPTGVTVSASTHEDRAFFSYYGANKGLQDLLEKPNARKVMMEARHVHFACAPDREVAAGLLPVLRAHKCRTSVDVGWHPSWLTDPRNLETLRESDLFFPNDREAELMTGESEPYKMLRAYRENGLRAVGLKLAGRGAALLWKQKEFVCDPLSVANVDTTGAGDCFDAGFIYGWLKSNSPQACLEIANTCGALSTRELGGIAAFPTIQELGNVLAINGK